MFGVYSATVGLAAAVGPLIGGELVHAFGWRGIFVANIPLILLAALLGRSTRPPPESVGTHAAPRPRTPIIGWLIEPSLFRNRVFAAGCLVIFLQSLAMYGVLFQLPQFFELVRGATPRATGLLLFVMMIGLFVASVAGGTLSDRLGARTTSLGGLVLMLAGILWLTRLASFFEPADAFGPVLLLGLSLGVTWAPAQSSAMSAVDEAQSGIAAGTTSACRYLGGAVGVLILALYFSAAVAAPVEVHERIVWMFGAAIALSLIGCLGLPGKPQSRKAAD
jgi:DHA2 family methylenomycin A resistance protein-like MFS transporter